MKKIAVKCERGGTGFIAVADNGGDGVEHIECGQHHPAFKDAPSVDELLAHIGKQTGISSSRVLRTWDSEAKMIHYEAATYHWTLGD